MHKISLVLGCLACVGHGQQLQASSEVLRSRLLAERQLPLEPTSSGQGTGAIAGQRTGATGTSDPLKALAMLFLTSNTAVAFTPPVPGMHMQMRNPARVSPSVSHRTPVMSVAGASAPSVELFQVFPMVPPISPDTKPKAVRIEGADLWAPVWTREFQAVMFLTGDEQALWYSGAGEATLQPIVTKPISAHTVMDLSIAAIVDSESGVLGAITLDSWQPTPLPLEGVDEIPAVSFVHPIEDSRLLVGTDDGQIILIRPLEPPMTLLSGFAPGSLQDAAISVKDKLLYICDETNIWRCTIDFDEGECSAPETVDAVAASVSEGSTLTGVTLDVDGRLYVSTDEGVIVFDESLGPLLRVSTPLPATGVCFGGPAMTELYITAGDTIWQVPTNARGWKQATAQEQETLGVMKASGIGVHEGW